VGISGGITQAFLRSKLTPLVTAAALAVGLLGILATPREEEPQISVPMIDVLAALPGASPAEAENLLVRPIERRMWEIPGVEYVYSTAGEGWAMVTVRFAVGEDQEISVTKVHAKLFAAMDEAPAGALPPLVKASDPRQFVLEVIDELKAVGQSVNTLRLGEHTIAKTVCRHAVKANDPLAGPELENLVNDLRRCAMPYTCPHGRPTLIELNYRELEKKFGRTQ